MTGAGGGIGRGCVHALLAAGWTVVLAGRRADALQATIDSCGAALTVVDEDKLHDNKITYSAEKKSL